MRKTLSILLSAALCLCTALSSTVTAINVEAKLSTDETISSVTYTNEYEYVQLLQSATEEELSALGMTQEEADEYLCTFQTALATRASLPEETLLALGYSEMEINLLKEYAAGSTLSDVELTALTGTCTGSLTCTSGTTTSAAFYYRWSWDHCPIMTLKDAAAVTWYAYNSSSIDVDVDETHSTAVYYYDTDSGAYHHRSSGSIQASLSFNALNLQFPVTERYIDGDDNITKYYAKMGIISVVINLDSESESLISYVRVAALYGHTEIGVSYPTIDVSITGPTISFSGNTSISALAGDKIKIRNSGSYSHI